MPDPPACLALVFLGVALGSLGCGAVAFLLLRSALRVLLRAMGR